MAKQRLWIAMLAIPMFFVFVFVTSAERSHPASASGVIDPTCSSSLPCIEYDNNSNGPGIRGVSLSGNGLIGFTKFNSTSLTNSREGLGGNDLSSTGRFNAGVRGLSTRGFGVAGQSTSGVGVSGLSTSNSGVQGVTSTTSSFVGGVAGSATSATGVSGKATTGIGVAGTGHFAVEGSDNNTGGDNIFANGTGGNLFRGNNSANLDVFKVDDSGNTTIGGNANIGGTAFISGAVLAAGVISEGFIAIDATASDSGIGLEGKSSTDPFSNAVVAIGNGGGLFEGTDSTGKVLFSVDGAGNVRAHSFTADLAVAQKTSSGRPLPTYTSEASAPTIEDFGEAYLQAGSAYVRLDPRYASAIARNSTYLVFITPQGPTRSSLYVTQKTPQGFQVRENYPGQETVAFDYRIVAKPYSQPVRAPQMPHGVQLYLRPQSPSFHKLILRKTHEPKPGLMNSRS